MTVNLDKQQLKTEVHEYRCENCKNPNKKKDEKRLRVLLKATSIVFCTVYIVVL